MGTLSAKVGVFGGTFDPPHIGHLVAAEEARLALSLEYILFVPVGDPYHKRSVRPVTAANHRVEMITRAIASNPHFRVSLIDVQRPGPTYTIDLIAELSRTLGNQCEFYFIVGSDSLNDLPGWHRSQKLVRSCRLAVIDRPGYEVDLDRLEDHIPDLSSRIDFIPMPLLEISSTALERRLHRGQSLRYFVPSVVEEYIRVHRLYT